MKWITLIVLFCVATLADARETNQPMRVTVKLRDGSVLVGTPRIDKLKVETSFAKLDLALEKIRELNCEKGLTKARLNLRNGDHLEGTIRTELLALDTILGK